ncbi:hypothetical protein [Streptomyces sp. NPDC004629]|uniref:hypothetical protein n=1 Tax=Streptomyces sp. NPDC004629 TaxID=3364705 RepID=UPI00368D060C
MPTGLRRRLHRRPADIVADPEERARQLALCVVAPDAAVAAELAASAQRRRRRGAPQIAAGLYEQAAGLTPSQFTADQGRRPLAAARCHHDGGDYRAAATAAAQVAEARGGDLTAAASRSAPVGRAECYGGVAVLEDGTRSSPSSVSVDTAATT